MDDRPDRLISLNEAAARLGLLRSTMRDAVARGYLLPARVTGDTCWFQIGVIDRYGRTLGLPPAAPSTPPSTSWASPGAA